MKRIEIEAEVAYKVCFVADVDEDTYNELRHIHLNRHGYLDGWSDPFCKAVDFLNREIDEDMAQDFHYRIRSISDSD